MRHLPRSLMPFSLLALGALCSLTACNQNDQRSDVVADHLDAAFIIEGRLIKLSGGMSEFQVVPGSAAKVVTRYFGNAISHDFNGDGREDLVFLLTQETGGTGVFFYVVAAIDTGDGYVGSQGLFLGDRIAPQTTEVGTDNIVTVNYTDHAPGESNAAPPSQGKSVRLMLDVETLQFAVN